LIAVENNDYTKAAELFEKSLKLREKLGDIHGQISSLNAFALARCRLGDISSAKDLGEKALQLAEKHSMGSVKAETQRTMAVIHAVSGNVKKGDEYFKKAMSIFEDSVNDLETARTYLDYGQELKKLKNRMRDDI
jgi:tetratricopeptide (TPR) repeat protein